MARAVILVKSNEGKSLLQRAHDDTIFLGANCGDAIKSFIDGLMKSVSPSTRRELELNKFIMPMLEKSTASSLRKDVVQHSSVTAGQLQSSVSDAQNASAALREVRATQAKPVKKAALTHVQRIEKFADQISKGECPGFLATIPDSCDLTKSVKNQIGFPTSFERTNASFNRKGVK